MTNVDIHKSKTREESRIGHKSQSERLKTVVRRLPPNLPEDVFWQSVQEWVTDATVSWKTYHQGKFRKRLNKENIPSRAYIAFHNEDMLATFSREYDGHLFRDKAGNESIAIVEFAPFQKVPGEKKKADSRIGTIEKDEDYISFLDSLKEVPAKFDLENIESLAAAIQAPAMPTTTPLLEALKAEKSAQKDKEAIQRNHAHYRDQASGSSAPQSKKEQAEEKRKATQAAAQKPADPPAQTGKRAGKKAAMAAKASQQQAGQQIPSLPGKNSAAKQPQPSQPAAPKAPRAHRERNPPKATPAPSAVPSTSTPQPPPAPNAAPRRTRPVIGLASRQFEAALNGAGVPVSGGGERKARRERAREREVSQAQGAPSGSGKAKSTDGREQRGGGSGTPAAPTILQRIPTPNNPPSVVDARAALPPPPASPQVLEGGGGRGGRNRGRGRGRGAPRGN